MARRHEIFLRISATERKSYESGGWTFERRLPPADDRGQPEVLVRKEIRVCAPSDPG